MPSRSASLTCFLTLALCCLVSTTPCAASAQAAGTPQRTRIAVLDFENPTGRLGPTLGQWAADALSLLLGGEHNEVVPREQVRRAVGDAPYREPMHVLVQAAAPLKVQEIVTGRVLKADVRKGMPGQAHVRLDVRVFDVELGILTRGCVADGVGPPHYDSVPPTRMLQEAAAKAAMGAARDLASCVVPRGSVLRVTPDECLVSIGSEAGLRAEQELVVRRGSETVGRLQVITVATRDAVCRALGGAGRIAVEDQVIGVYRTGVSGSATGRQKGPSPGSLPPHLRYLLARQPHRPPYRVAGIRAAAVAGDRPGIRVTWSRVEPAPPDILGFRIYRSRTQYGNYELVGKVENARATEFLDLAADRVLLPKLTDTRGNPPAVGELPVRGVRPGETYYYRVTCVYAAAKPEQATGPAPPHDESDFTPPTTGTALPARTGAAAPR